MRLTIQLLAVAALAAVSGCASKAPKFADGPGTGPSAAGNAPIVKPSDMLAGKVIAFNVVGRFAVLNFPVTRMPAVGQKLFVYRDGLKVGAVKITGPQKDDNIVADLADGEAKPGDEVRDR